MALEIHPSDLLPEVFDWHVKRYRRTDLLDVERTFVYEALLNSLRWTVLRRAADEASVSVSFSFQELRTTDRFAARWMARREIVDRIQHSSGLARSLANVALLLIEARVDLTLASSADGEVVITSLGSIRTAESDRPGPVHEALHQTYGPLLGGGASESLLETIELSRAPLAYQMKLAEDLAITRQEPSQGQPWPESAEASIQRKSRRPGQHGYA